MEANITILPGDGIGPEVVQATTTVLETIGDRFGHTFRLTEKQSLVRTRMRSYWERSVDLNGMIPVRQSVQNRVCWDYEKVWVCLQI